jgi:hypothetical protein
MSEDRQITRRPRIRHQISFKERLLNNARQAREAAELLAPGSARDELLRKARASETAAHIDEWVSSPGLRPPTGLDRPGQMAPRRSKTPLKTPPTR